MQVYQPSTMAFPSICKFGFITYHLANNRIGDIGCLFLSKADWSCMKNLDLRINRISSDGIKELIKYHWSCLLILRLGKSFMFRLKSYNKHRLSLALQRIIEKSIRTLFG